MQHNTNSVQRAQTTCGHSTTKRNGHCSQHMACNPQQTPCKMRKTSCSMHYAADATANNRSRATCTKQRAACNSYRAEKSNQQATCRMQQTTDSRRRATDSRRHARGRVQRAYTCELQRQIHGTAVFRARRAGGQRTTSQHARSIVLDNQCATRHGRHTQDATYDPCRSMQQTRMKRHRVRRKKSGSSRTSGLCQLPPYHRAGKHQVEMGEERLKLAKRQETAEAKERESAEGTICNRALSEL
jgi:hypothetical protein